MLFHTLYILSENSSFKNTPPVYATYQLLADILLIWLITLTPVLKDPNYKLLPVSGVSID